MDTPQSPTSPKRSRGFSVKSGNSDKSGSTSHKRGFSESSEEKARRNLHTKADPLIAMNEMQPMTVALEKSNLGSLREIQFKDQYGNVITDPDLSNPTRPRFERPLDTIRSFEAAINSSYSNNRASYAKTDDAASQMGDYSRRTSYYGGQNSGPSNRNYEQNNYYGQTQSRPDSIVNAYQNTPLSPENPNPYPYAQSGHNQGRYSPNSRRRPSHHPRGSPSTPMTPSEGYPNMANSSQYGYQRSRDNVAAMSNNSSSNTYPYGQSTDPSSLNSSNDQLQQQALQQQRLDERAQEYGFSGFNSPRAPQPIGDPTWGGPVGGTPTSVGAAPPQSVERKNVNQSSPGGQKSEKRKSWFKRRFSKD
ncbi:hypothetical protein PENNAL_c0056G11674 [Penicillium nalgiovense]|uniref:DUF2406 domain-containing protein n=2 Tax=Penicillium nalgiovense TaxID=60175 RepID=A0A1V6XTH7_PENNA|nr:hypothetical protein PENNAL_c0056G11674 [Penicillium nalgiovense]CAG8163957.1 unnamed protein product [Penicillium nalgiovense]CAG8176578.1 unnamed protein product [Penicillium nalgiovense]CAG8238307.1 unnamed protein product [Penicillium nalgiovense]